MELQLTDGQRNLYVNQGQAISLEIKLNVSEFGFIWKSVGDHLFFYGTRRNVARKLVLTREQFSFLEELIKQYKICESATD
jgi:hypothetical protein